MYGSQMGLQYKIMPRLVLRCNGAIFHAITSENYTLCQYLCHEKACQMRLTA